MIIFWSALVISSALSAFIYFRVPNFHGWDIWAIIVFFVFSFYVLVEIMKWPLGKKKLDNTKGLAKYVFGDMEIYYWGGPSKFFSRESIFSIQGRNKYLLWGHFILSLIGIFASLAWLFKGD